MAKGRPKADIRFYIRHRANVKQLAFVFKLSVESVDKMEHLGTSPVKGLESRRALLKLARALENPSPGICSYIEQEEAALG